MSYTCLNYHVVFATKDRELALNEELLLRLIPYLAGMTVELGSKAFLINGVEDHLHLLISVSPKTAFSEFMRTLKSYSSRWIHKTFPEQKSFAWQEGYSAFTVSRSGMDKVYGYIQNQKEHHQKMGYIDELKKLLDAHQIQYDPRYLK